MHKHKSYSGSSLELSTMDRGNLIVQYTHLTSRGTDSTVYYCQYDSRVSDLLQDNVTYYKEECGGKQDCRRRNQGNVFLNHKEHDTTERKERGEEERESSTGKDKRGQRERERDTVETERAAVEYKPLSCWLQLDFSSSTHTRHAYTHAHTRTKIQMHSQPQ